MKQGDVVDYQGATWLVLKVSSQTHLATLLDPIGGRVEVPESLGEASGLKVLASPSTNWNLVIAPTRKGIDPIVGLTLPPDRLRYRALELVPWVDWVPVDPFKSGGAIYLNPVLPITRGNVLIATHRSGSKTRVPVPLNFGTVGEKRASKGIDPYIPSDLRTRYNRKPIL